MHADLFLKTGILAQKSRLTAHAQVNDTGKNLSPIWQQSPLPLGSREAGAGRVEIILMQRGISGVFGVDL